MLKESHSKGFSGYVLVFTALTTLFLLRVLAQLFQLFFNVSWLPLFSTWQSGILSYKYLLIFQIFILSICIWISRQFQTESPIPNQNMGRIFLMFGGIYFVVMTIRIIVGLTIAKDHPWFGALLPSFFHLILAAIVLTLGHYHLRRSGSLKI